MNYLCVCQGGCVRSVALAYAVKYCTGRKKNKERNNAWAVGMDHFEYDVIPQKVQKGPLDFANLVENSDATLAVTEDVYRQIESTLVVAGRQNLMSKVTQLEIGEDRWGLKLGPYSEDLVELCVNELNRVGIK